MWGVGDQVTGSSVLHVEVRGRGGGQGGHPKDAKGMAVLRVHGGWGLVFLTSSGIFLRNRT